MRARSARRLSVLPARTQLSSVERSSGVKVRAVGYLLMPHHDIDRFSMQLSTSKNNSRAFQIQDKVYRLLHSIISTQTTPSPKSQISARLPKRSLQEPTERNAQENDGSESDNHSILSSDPNHRLWISILGATCDGRGPER